MHAWTVVNIWTHVKAKRKMPNLDSLLRRLRPSKPQSVKAMKAAIDVLAGQYGIRPRVRGRKKAAKA